MWFDSNSFDRMSHFSNCITTFVIFFHFFMTRKLYLLLRFLIFKIAAFFLRITFCPYVSYNSLVNWGIMLLWISIYLLSNFCLCLFISLEGLCKVYFERTRFHLRDPQLPFHSQFHSWSSFYLTISGQCSHFIPPEKTRKPKVFWCFQWGIKWEHWPEREKGFHCDVNLYLRKKCYLFHKWVYFTTVHTIILFGSKFNHILSQITSFWQKQEAFVM